MAEDNGGKRGPRPNLLFFFFYFGLAHLYPNFLALNPPRLCHFVLTLDLPINRTDFLTHFCWFFLFYFMHSYFVSFFVFYNNFLFWPLLPEHLSFTTVLHSTLFFNQTFVSHKNERAQIKKHTLLCHLNLYTYVYWIFGCVCFVVIIH